MKRLAFLISAVVAGPVHAQGMFCAPHATIAERLVETFSEAPVFLGLDNQAAFRVEVWVNAETGTFTILRTGPTMNACVVATGVAGGLLDLPALGTPG